MKKMIAVLSFAVLATGCATQKNWSAVGGSKADGTVELAYEYGLFESPTVNENQATQLAASRCQAWGYESAEAFGGAIKTCSFYSSGGCNAWLVKKKYQCTGEQ